MAVDIIARAMAANASSGGGSSSAFPIIDATGETEIDLDNYLEEGTWFIKGNNVKQMKNSNYEFMKTSPSAILTIRTVNGATYQSLEFPNLAYSTSTGSNIYNYIGARKIKPSIDERFQLFSIPTRITDNYTSGIFNDSRSYAFSQSGANELYTEIIEAIGKFGTSSGLAKLTKLKTTDKHSLVNAINELVDTKQDKLTAGSGITIENNVISASGGIPSFVGTQDNPITLTSNDIVKEPICLISGYIVDSPVYNNRNIEDTLILYNLTDRDAIGAWRRKTQVIYLGYGALTNIFTAFYSYTRDIQLGTSSDLWSVSRDWRTGYCNYEYSQYYKSDMPGLQLFNQHGAHNMYIELMSYLTDTVSNKPLLSGLETTNKSSLVAAINEVAKGSSGSAFPIIDATGETEIDLDNYLDDGTWIIKGNNVKQIKEYSDSSINETNWAMLEIKTHKWLSNSYVYQILQFPMMVFNNGIVQKHLNYGIRQIKPSIESSFKNYALPASMINYYNSFPDDGYNKVLSAVGSYNMYTELMSYLTNNINKKPRLSDLNTTDKTSLVNAINEINSKITSGTFATNLSEVQGYDATKTQVLKNVNGQFTWVDES